MRPLEPREQKQLKDALLSAFPNYASLKPVVSYNLGDTLQNVAGTGPLRGVVDELVEWVVAQHKVEALIRGALEENPGNPLLKAFATQVLLSSPPLSTGAAGVGGADHTGGAGGADDGRLERLVLRDSPFTNMPAWRAKAARCEAAVCRVVLPDMLGTGSLLGPDVVITNYHVLEGAIGGGTPPGKVRFVFDYKVDPATGLPGAGVPVSLVKQNWLIASSPESQLDYALVRLDGRPGSEPGPGAGSRGWLTPVERRFQPGEAFFVIQHPGGDPMQIAGGAVLSVDTVGQRVVYSTNTLEGSSGAPGFTMGWDLIALHHYGKTSGNRGVLFSSILADLKDKAVRLADPAPEDADETPASKPSAANQPRKKNAVRGKAKGQGDAR